MTANKKIVGGYLIIIFMILIAGLVSIFTVVRMTDTSDRIYTHPFAVSNAARDIKINLLSIQSDMKDLFLSEDPGHIESLKKNINSCDKVIDRDLQLLFERFLGDKRDVQRLYDIFNESRIIRGKIISLAEAGKAEEAASLAKREGNKYADALNGSSQVLISFATGKAEEFRIDIRKGRMFFLYMTIFSISFMIAISLFVTSYAVRNLRKSQYQLARHLYLVDQNVLVCSMDSEGYVQDISSALCRLLGFTKEEIINSKSNFFVGETNQDLLEDIMRTIHTGKEWEGIIERLDGEGSKLWIHSKIYPVLDQTYSVSGYSNIIENITDKKSIEELSLRDRLTGLHNRRYYEENIEMVIKAARREDKYLTLSIMDIDFFKNYNDNYGHPAGDLVLSQVAGVFRRMLNRPTDHSIRIGGEEFCIIFTGSDREKSIEFLEEIRNSIEGLKIQHQFSEVSRYVTVSAGAIVGLGRDISDKEQLYRQADEALYKAKRERNKLVIS